MPNTSLRQTHTLTIQLLMGKWNGFTGFLKSLLNLYCDRLRAAHGIAAYEMRYPSSSPVIWELYSRRFMDLMRHTRNTLTSDGWRGSPQPFAANEATTTTRTVEEEIRAWDSTIFSLCAELQIAIFKWMTIETIASLIQSGHTQALDVFIIHERSIFLGMIKERYPWADSLFAPLDTVLRWLATEKEGRENHEMTDEEYEKSVREFKTLKERLVEAHYAVLELRRDNVYAFGPCWKNTLENGSYGYVQLLEQIDEEVGRAMELLGTRNFAATLLLWRLSWKPIHGSYSRLRLQAVRIEEPQRSYVSCERWRDGKEIPNTLPLGKWCQKAVQRKSISKKCATIEDAPIQVQADFYALLARLGDNFSRKFDYAGMSYLQPLIPILGQPQQNGRDSKTNPASTSTQEHLLIPLVEGKVQKLDVDRSKWLSQVTKQYFFDRFLPDELTKIGLHKGMPEWKDYVNSELRDQILSVTSVSNKNLARGSFAEVEAAIERRCRERGIPLDGKSRFL
ncbi:hypothetical protein AOQ84DRAFT_156444 [Glonium stellatum]|uniref:Uncharacterized protein n=1 Tax=Glonium stellatum TaxID=574774 RepID=A0A8E2ERE3_9PEZI|nr:hypothetical protein AOQ84DRAFT_156444 [Glonium stellatum]